MSGSRSTAREISEFEALIATHAERPTNVSWEAVEQLLDHYPEGRPNWNHVRQVRARYLAFVRESIIDAAAQEGDTESLLTLALMALCGYTADRTELQEGMLLQRVQELVLAQYRQEIFEEDLRQHFVDNGPVKNLRVGITDILKIRNSAGNRRGAAIQRAVAIAKLDHDYAQILVLHLVKVGAIKRIESYGLTVGLLVQWGIKFAELHFNEPRTHVGP